MGDTALIRGIAAAVKQPSPRVRVVGVQAERAPSYYRSWRENRVVETETCDTIADALATRTPGAPNVRAVKKLVDGVVLVSEEQMLRAIELLLREEHVLAEPAGAASTAALLSARADYGERRIGRERRNIAREVFAARHLLYWANRSEQAGHGQSGESVFWLRARSEMTERNRPNPVGFSPPPAGESAGILVGHKTDALGVRELARLAYFGLPIKPCLNRIPHRLVPLQA